jgi:hypothetical protein
MTTVTSSTARWALVVGLGGLLATVAFASSAAPTLAANARGLPPPSQVRTANTSASATYTPKPKPKLKHHKPKPKPRPHPRRHHAAHTYVYQLGFPEGATEASSCSAAPYTMTTNVGAVNSLALSVIVMNNGYPLATILFQPGKTLFNVTDAPGESGNAQFVRNICDFAAPNGDSANCAVRGTATYHTSTPVRNLAKLTSRPAYSIIGVVDNVVGNFPCGNTPAQPPW